MVGVATPPARPQARPLRLNRLLLLSCEAKGAERLTPPSAGPLAGLWRGKRDEAGRGPLKHKPTALFMSVLNSKKENAQS